MYDMMNSVSASRIPAGSWSALGAVRNVRGRSEVPAMDPISLAGASRRAGVRRPGASARICGVRTSDERRHASR